ncbi:MAG: GC-type dockerin domain-anchored protein [Phycisphaerales bacterium JB040]
MRRAVFAVVLLVSAAHAPGASQLDGRRYEILVLDGRLYAHGYLLNYNDDGNGVSRPYFNAQHNHWGSRDVGGSVCLLGFDLYEPGPLVGHRVWLEMVGSFRWDNPPLLPTPGTEPVLEPLATGEYILARYGGVTVSTETLGALTLSEAVDPGGFVQANVRYDTPAQPTDYLLGVTYVLRTDAPGVADSDPLHVIFATGDAPTPVERLHYSALHLEATLGLYLCRVDLNGDRVLDNGDIGSFVDFYLDGNTIADVNEDGVLDNGDISAFVRGYLAGC